MRKNSLAQDNIEKSELRWALSGTHFYTDKGKRKNSEKTDQNENDKWFSKWWYPLCRLFDHDILLGNKSHSVSLKKTYKMFENEWTSSAFKKSKKSHFFHSILHLLWSQSALIQRFWRFLTWYHEPKLSRDIALVIERRNSLLPLNLDYVEPLGTDHRWHELKKHAQHAQ
jgi:hypothetical protein